MGRPSKATEWLTEENLELIEALARRGLNDKEICESIGVKYETFRDWKRKFPPFSTYLKKGRIYSLKNVENALYSRAVGCTVTETTVEISDKDGRKTKTVTKQLPPDVGAIVFILKNRLGRYYRGRPDENIIEEIEDDGLLAALKSSKHRLVEDEAVQS